MSLQLIWDDRRVIGRRVCRAMLVAAAACSTALANTTVTVTTTATTADGDSGSVERLIAKPGADGKISLTEAIAAVNSTGPGFTIGFNLPVGSAIFSPFTERIVQPNTVLDGDVNGDAAPDVLIYPPARTSALRLQASGCIVRSLAVSGLGIAGAGTRDCQVVDCYIGTDVSGEVASPGQTNGIEITGGAHHNTVERCVIAGNAVPDPNWNAAGVFIFGGSHHNTVRSCRIGLNVNGAALANEIGIQVGANGSPASDNLVGGPRQGGGVQGPGNVISGNSTDALVIDGAGSTGNIVQGNFIGTDISGTSAIPNGSGLYIAVAVSSGAANNTIGGTRLTAAGGEGNLISGNSSDGLGFLNAGTAGNVAQGNLIGTDISGITELSNGGYGAAFGFGAANNVLGSSIGEMVDPNKGNVIRANAHGGVLVQDATSTGNTFRGNSIDQNGGRGINLVGNERAAGDGVTPNDVDDSDTGPNGLLNFPVGVTVAFERYREKWVVSCLVTSPEPESVTVDFYSSASLDEVGFGEGRAYLGSADADASGVARLEVLGPLPLGHIFVSATATDISGNTSEFSPSYGDPDTDGRTDTDGDGLPDEWEARGIDFDGDGTPDLALHDAPFDADPMHKDIFLEIDYMEAEDHTHHPDLRPDKGPLPETPLRLVDDAFWNAPVPNPDGGTGVDLHVMVDEAIPDVPSTRMETLGPGTTDDFYDFKDGLLDDPTDGHLGTPDERASDDAWKVLGARRLAFHYVLFAHAAHEGDTIGGQGETEADDIMMTLANWAPAARDVAGAWSATGTITPTEDEFNEEWIDAVASSFMHELGHNLGLVHGGGVGIPSANEDNRSVNRKPNYLSVMNYNHNFNAAGDATNLPGIADGKLVRLNRPLDYSRSALPTLLETNLDEAAGIGGAAGARTLYGVKGARRIGPADAPIDWNGNQSVTDTHVSANINDIGRHPSPTGRLEALHGHDDWANLLYNFRAGPLFGRLPSGTDVALGEPTAEDYLAECLGGPRGPADALRIAGGLLSANGADLLLMNTVTAGGSATRLDLLDAVRAARRAAGLEP